MENEKFYEDLLPDDNVKDIDTDTIKEKQDIDPDDKLKLRRRRPL
jgi:hypothetical protein